MDSGEAAQNDAMLMWEFLIHYAPSNVSSLSASYKQHENIKRRAYGQRIQEVEHGSFTPIVLSATGGMA